MWTITHAPPIIYMHMITITDLHFHYSSCGPLASLLWVSPCAQTGKKGFRHHNPLSDQVGRERTMAFRSYFKVQFKTLWNKFKNDLSHQLLLPSHSPLTRGGATLCPPKQGCNQHTHLQQERMIKTVTTWSH